MQKQQIPLKNSLLLLLAAIIWGIAFVAQSVGMKYVGGFTFNAVRSLIGAVVLILVIDYFFPKVEGVKLSCIQFLTCGILSGIPALLLEHPELSSILAAWQPILYAGVMSCGVAYTLQIIGQKNMNPTVASLILSLESCISVLAGWIILRQQLSTKEILGCVIMFAAIILAQLPQKQTE